MRERYLDRKRSNAQKASGPEYSAYHKYKKSGHRKRHYRKAHAVKASEYHRKPNGKTNGADKKNSFETERHYGKKPKFRDSPPPHFFCVGNPHFKEKCKCDKHRNYKQYRKPTINQGDGIPRRKKLG